MLRLVLVTASALLAFALCGCPNGNRQQNAKLPPAAEQTEEQAREAGVAMSLFKDTPMMVSPPDAISFSRDGNMLWARGLDQTTQEFYVIQLSVGDESLTPQFKTQGPDLIVSYAQSAPMGEECLVLSQYQPKAGGPVRDVVYRVGEQFGEDLQWRSLVPWENIKGIPKIQEELFAFTSPFYSWDSADILIPFKGQTGVAVIDKSSGGGAFAPYPQTGFPGGFHGVAMGPLPEENGKRRAWASFWQQGSGEDRCKVYSLDLDTLDWSHTFDLQWIAYICSAPQPTVLPWTVWGSYSRLLEDDPQFTQIERGGGRIPRLAQVVPGAGTQDPVPLHGQPLWHIALDPLGEYVFYVDIERKGLVRLKPATGELDIDPRWFSNEDEKMKLFIAGGGERCFAWLGDVLIEAKWEEHQDLQGNDE